MRTGNLPPDVTTQKPKERSSGFATIVPFTAIAAGIAVATYEAITNVLPDNVEEPSTPIEKLKTDSKDSVPSNYNYSATGEIMRKLVFRGNYSTGEIQNRYVALFEQINRAQEGHFFYFDGEAQLLEELVLPDELTQLQGTLQRSEFEKKLQIWHNNNRKRLMPEGAICPDSFDSVGYPFVGSPKLPEPDSKDNDESDVDSDNRTMISVVMERLNDKLKSGDSKPEYFGGRERKIFDAISEIAQAYEIPLSIAFGLAANESGYDQNAISSAQAKGIYQFTAGGFADAKKWADSHPELSKNFRNGAIGNFEASWHNRFISAEMFCAYYRYLTEKLRDNTEKLESRLRKLDPSLPIGCFREIAVINAYNAGEGTISGSIDRFVALTDEEIERKLGVPPYGVDAWLGMLAHSFGLQIDGNATNVGLHVFTYPQKVVALGSLIREEQNLMLRYDQSNTMSDMPSGEEMGTIASTIKGPLRAVGGMASMLAGTIAYGVGTLGMKNSRTSTHSRRDFLRGFVSAGVGAIGITIPATDLMRKLSASVVKIKPDITEPVPPNADSAVFARAKQYLDERHAQLDQAYSQNGLSGWTAREKNARTSFDTVQQRVLLTPFYEKMMGHELFKRFVDSKDLKTKKRAAIYAEVSAAQDKYIEREKAKGNLVPIATNNPDASYFPEQVGKTSGISNDPDALFMHKNFEWIIPTIIELVNYQVDKFNANPTVYGITDADFPTLPHISAIKISGALRPVSQTKRMLEGGQGGEQPKTYRRTGSALQ